MIKDEVDSFAQLDVFKKQINNKLQYDDLDCDLVQQIQFTLYQFQECLNDTDLELLTTPLLMLLDILEDNIESEEIMPQILSYFEEYFPIFFSLNPQQDYDFNRELINIVAFITKYLDYSKYHEYVSPQFFQNLVEFLEDETNIINIIKIASNVFVDVNFEDQLYIINLFSPLLTKLPNEEQIQRQIYKFVYIMIKYIKQYDEEDFHFIESLLKCNSRYIFSYYYSFYSIGNLISQGFDAELFMTPEYISIYNECLYSSNTKILISDFFVLFTIVNYCNNDDFSELFDYKQAIEVTFSENQKEQIVLGGLDFLISSAACGSSMQEYLLEFNLFPIIEEMFDSSSFKVRLNLSYLYINLVPRDYFAKRVMLLETHFFLEYILLLFESYSQDLQRIVLNIVYHTLLKGESLNDNQYHLFLIENGFYYILENLSLDDKKLISYVDAILNMLQNV